MMKCLKFRIKVVATISRVDGACGHHAHTDKLTRAGVEDG